MSKRAGSTVPKFRIRVPAKIVDRLRGKRVLLSMSPPDDYPFVRTVTIGGDVSFNLGTDDRTIAEARQASALDHLRRLFDLIEAAPISLSHARSSWPHRRRVVHGFSAGFPEVVNRPFTGPRYLQYPGRNAGTRRRF